MEKFKEYFEKKINEKREEIKFSGNTISDLMDVFNKLPDNWNEEGYIKIKGDNTTNYQFFLADIPTKQLDKKEIWVTNVHNDNELKIKISEIEIIEPYIRD